MDQFWDIITLSVVDFFLNSGSFNSCLIVTLYQSMVESVEGKNRCLFLLFLQKNTHGPKLNADKNSGQWTERKGDKRLFNNVLGIISKTQWLTKIVL